MSHYFVSIGMGNVLTSFSSEAPTEQAVAPLIDAFANWLLTKGMEYGQYVCLGRLCEDLLDKTPGGEEYAWPRANADPVKVWDELKPHINHWRFIVYIVWLRKRPESFAKFCKLKVERKEAFEACMKRLFEHVKHEEEFQTQKEPATTV